MAAEPARAGDSANLTHLMPQTPGIGFPPDSETNLWRDVSRNLFELAQGYGYNLTLEPNALDSPINSQRKSVTFTAFIAENI